MKEILQLLFDMTFSTSVFILAILGIRFLFKNSSKNSRLLLWLLVGIKLLLPFNLESKFSLIPKNLVDDPTNNMQNVVSEVAFQNIHKKQIALSNETVLFIVWVTGFALILIYGAVSFWRLHKNISDAVKKEGNLFQSEKVVSPFVLGIIKPKIYTPFNLDDETLSHIVSHEKSHVRNLDHITKLLAFVLLAVHWFNPLVWISFMLFTKDIELACDERVVKNYSLERRKSYAEALLNCAVNEGRGLIYPVAFGEVSVKDRIKSVVAYKKTMKTVLALFLGVVIVATVCLGTVPKVSAKEPAQNEIPVVEETTTEVYVEEITTEAYVEETTEPEIEKETAVKAESEADNKNSGASYEADETVTVVDFHKTIIEPYYYNYESSEPTVFYDYRNELDSGEPRGYTEEEYIEAFYFNYGYYPTANVFSESNIEVTSFVPGEVKALPEFQFSDIN